MILCECVGSSGHSLLAYAIIQNSHELALKVWPDPSSTSLLFSVQAAKAVMILCECVGSSGHSLLAYAIIQNSH